MISHRRDSGALHTGGFNPCIAHHLTCAGRKATVARIRALLRAHSARQGDPPSAEIIPLTLREPCPECGGPMRIIEIFRRGQKPRSRAPPREQAA